MWPMTRFSISRFGGVALCCLATIGACDSEESSAPKTDPSCSSAIQTLCTGYIDYRARCDGLTAAERGDELARCEAEPDLASVSCVYAEAVADCLSKNSCDTSDDRCVYEGFLASSPKGWDVPTLRSCIAGTITDKAVCTAAVGGDTRTCIDRLEQCIGGPYAGAIDPPFTDDHCYTIVALTAAAQAKALDCLSLGCDAIGSCLTQAGTFNY